MQQVPSPLNATPLSWHMTCTWTIGRDQWAHHTRRKTVPSCHDDTRRDHQHTTDGRQAMVKDTISYWVMVRFTILTGRGRRLTATRGGSVTASAGEGTPNTPVISSKSYWSIFTRT